MIKFIHTTQFRKDLKRLSKKYPSLPDDMSFLELGLRSSPRKHIEIADIGEGYEGEFYKVKYFRCKSIGKNSTKTPIRIIYRYLEQTDEIKYISIEFIELYHKNTQSDFDHSRLEQYRTL